MYRKTPDEMIVLGICAICLIGLIPFAIIRFSRGDWPVAIVDLTGAFFTALCFLHVYRTGRIGFVGRFLATLALAGMTMNILVLGPGDLYFLYPVVLAAFFMMPPVTALIMTVATAVAVAAIIFPLLALFDVIRFLLSILGTIMFAFVFAWQRNRQRDELIRQSTVDPLTGAGNRRALRDRLEQLITAREREHHPMSLIILDLDDFKVINDRAGHLTGDQVLTRLTAIVRSRIRATDHLYRYGGDEFMVLADHSDAMTARKLAEDIRGLIDQDRTITDIRMTVSIGIAEYRPGETADEWLLRADDAMYTVKRSGKNAVSGTLEAVPI